MYRLEVIGVSLPPLRARTSDIVNLLKHFLTKENPIASKVMDEQLTQRLYHYSWPGNVRQLQNAAAYMGAMSEGPVLTINDLPDEIRLSGACGIQHSGAVVQVEQSAPHPDDIDEFMVREALVRCKNRKTRAAEHLGISRTTLWRLIKRFNL